ncbi:MlaE family ABC transporter permease [Marinifilum caeruleilacunae]|jgi:phospholipid/cholesterol/gamma-HCH transport system permease protein|uniref:ABC transporter permease n=1 Tax=Marinifilum caeruleilacunae TaxID=2499076 RepID=A0ABX1WZH7_9BACT|nr:ABC transporter permease [Marinifilum caeruleilacunae]NOU61235.1 ABC transporter permease [Marinifilum caeruleilacunae]
MNLFEHVGKFSRFLILVLSKPEKGKLFFSQIVKEIHKLGINSIGIVVIISLFMGAVIALQTAYNLMNPLLPEYLVGYTTRESMILEFSSTIVGLILAGKVGSNIASEIGSMRVTEQIDALEIMGINSASYLILPKIVAAIFINPFLYVLSVFVGILGGLLASYLTSTVPLSDFIYGTQFGFIPYYITYSLVKTVVFAFIITAIPSYYGYYVKGGALEVGKASTKAVVNSSILILLANVILTQILLK